MLFILFLLPSFWNELMWVLKYLWIVEAVDPTSIQISTFGNRNSSDCDVFSHSSLERKRNRWKYSWNFRYDTVHERYFLHIFNCDILVRFNDTIHLLSQSFYNCWFLKDVEKNSHKHIGWSFRSPTDKSFDIVHYILFIENMFFSIGFMWLLFKKQLNNGFLSLFILLWLMIILLFFFD